MAAVEEVTAAPTSVVNKMIGGTPDKGITRRQVDGYKQNEGNENEEGKEFDDDKEEEGLSIVGKNNSIDDLDSVSHRQVIAKKISPVFNGGFKSDDFRGDDFYYEDDSLNEDEEKMDEVLPIDDVYAEGDDDEQDGMYLEDNDIYAKYDDDDDDDDDDDNFVGEDGFDNGQDRMLREHVRKHRALRQIGDTGREPQFSIMASNINVVVGLAITIFAVVAIARGRRH